MRIVQHREVIVQALQLVCEEHVKSVNVDGSAASSARGRFSVTPHAPLIEANQSQHAR
jgi:hypothetical protein